MSIQLSYFNAADFYCDGGASFGVVPKKVWQKRYPCDDDNLCRMSMRCFVIKTDSRLIVVDTGVGNKQLDYLKYYNIEGVASIGDEMARMGYSCEEVTDVVLTHLHFDHCGGCTYYDESGELCLRFPYATHWVGKAQWENFENPNVREGNSYFPENMSAVEEAGRLRLVEQNEWLCDEVELRLFEGHTVGFLMPYLPTYQGGAFLVGDVFPTAVSLPPAWISAYDILPLSSMREKGLLLHEAAMHGCLFVFQHDAYTLQGKVVCVNGHYRLQDVVTIP
ncbi:MAG: MBL fold metallo-hydrolase [Paludibacteraceae bacterium]|nr:MBL fold metallo-hydrolase [Paludibacteraceae bacterium]